MLGQFMALQIRQAHDGLEAAQKSQTEDLTRDIKALGDNEVKLHSELSKLGGDVSELHRWCVSQVPLLGKFSEFERQNTKLELEQQAIIQRLGFVQTKMGEAAHQNAQKIASLERENLEFKALLRDLVSEQQAPRVQQAKLARAVSGVLDQFHGLDF